MCVVGPHTACTKVRGWLAVWSSLHHVVPGTDLSSMRLGCKNFYLLSHLKASLFRRPEPLVTSSLGRGL